MRAVWALTLIPVQLLFRKTEILDGIIWPLIQKSFFSFCWRVLLFPVFSLK